jgi:hypothetical protein
MNSEKANKTNHLNARSKHKTQWVKCDGCNVERPLAHFTRDKRFYKKKMCSSCIANLLSSSSSLSPLLHSCKINANQRVKKAVVRLIKRSLDSVSGSREDREGEREREGKREGKETTTLSFLGCNIQYLREWLAYNFLPGMTWDNFGTHWLIGQVVEFPEICDLNEISKAWNWTNLRPILVEEREKGEEEEEEKLVVEKETEFLRKLSLFKEEGSTTKWFSGNGIDHFLKR